MGVGGWQRRVSLGLLCGQMAVVEDQVAQVGLLCLQGCHLGGPVPSAASGSGAMTGAGSSSRRHGISSGAGRAPRVTLKRWFVRSKYSGARGRSISVAWSRDEPHDQCDQDEEQHAHSKPSERAHSASKATHHGELLLRLPATPGHLQCRARVLFSAYSIMPAPVLVLLIMPVPVPVLVVGGVAVLVLLIMPAFIPVLVVGGVAVPVPLIMRVRVALLVWLVMVVPVRLIMVVLAWGIVPISVQMVIMGAVVPSMMPMLVPLIMLAFVL